MDAQQQCANAVLMIRPAAFDYNMQTAASNRMQRHAAQPGTAVNALARAEFDQAVQALRTAGVRICVIEDTPQPPKPDAVFPNNWVSWHADGTVVLYPMQAANRRPERRREVLDRAAAELGFSIRRILDLSHHEAEGRYLEGTGSLVLDHVARVAYACRSPRTDEALVREWAAELGYRPEVFGAQDDAGAPFYHTNVMLSIGARAAVVAAAAIVPADRMRVLAALQATQREIIEIDQDAVCAFAANLLELSVRDPLRGPSSIIALSASARAGLGPRAYERLQACTGGTVVLAVPTIERLGGGSVRCMLAEVFLRA